MHPDSEFIRVVVIDGIAASRRRLSALLTDKSDIEVVGLARTAAEGVQLAQLLKPHVVVLASTPDGDPLHTVRQLATGTPSAYIVLVTVSSDMPYIQEAFMAGVRRVVPHPPSADQLAGAIRGCQS